VRFAKPIKPHIKEFIDLSMVEMKLFLIIKENYSLVLLPVLMELVKLTPSFSCSNSLFKSFFSFRPFRKTSTNNQISSILNTMPTTFFYKSAHISIKLRGFSYSFSHPFIKSMQIGETINEGVTIFEEKSC